MNPDKLQAKLEQFPRLRLAACPTPLERMSRITKVLAGPTLWIKRDDGIGPGMGGNKGRKLEFLLADAKARGKHKIVTYGGLQSNHARMTAAVCAKLGMSAHLFFFEKRPPRFEGNLLLNALLDARMHFLPVGGGSSGRMTIESTNRLVHLVSTLIVGPGGYFIPVGGHNALGCLGYVVAALEIQKQVEAEGLPLDKVTLVTAVGTGGTLAGLSAGLALLESPIKLVGIDVGKLWKKLPSSLASMAGQICKLLGHTKLFQPDDVPIVEGTYVGSGGYASFTRRSANSMKLLAQHEGILLDPVYTGKAFAGMVDQCEKLGKGEHVVFLHTGGTPGIWAFGRQLEALF